MSSRHLYHPRYKIWDNKSIHQEPNLNFRHYYSIQQCKSSSMIEAVPEARHQPFLFSILFLYNRHQFIQFGKWNYCSRKYFSFHLNGQQARSWLYLALWMFVLLYLFLCYVFMINVKNKEYIFLVGFYSSFTIGYDNYFTCTRGLLWHLYWPWQKKI